MSTIAVSLDEYLQTSYSPDREYVDGVILERRMGERPHSLVQRNIVIYLQTHYPERQVWPEQRVLTVPGRRSRVPDVCVTAEDPRTDIFTAPPLIVIEILSRRDEMTEVLEKLAEYDAFGVPVIWLVDPRRRKVFCYSGARLEELGVLTAKGIEMPLEEVFRGL